MLPGGGAGWVREGASACYGQYSIEQLQTTTVPIFCVGGAVGLRAEAFYCASATVQGAHVVLAQVLE